MVRRRVHISNATLSFLNGEFEVEPAHGEDREEALQKAGIVTYFIVRALKPFIPAVTKSLASLTDAENRRAMENLGDGRNNKEDSEEFRQRLRKELDSKSKQIEASFLISIANYLFFFSFVFKYYILYILYNILF